MPFFHSYPCLRVDWMFKMSRLNSVKMYEWTFLKLVSYYHCSWKQKHLVFVNTDVNERREHSMMADPCIHVHVLLCLVARCHAFFGVDLEPDRPFSVLSIPEEVTRHSLLKKNKERKWNNERHYTYNNNKVCIYFVNYIRYFAIPLKCCQPTIFWFAFCLFGLTHKCWWNCENVLIWDRQAESRYPKGWTTQFIFFLI